MSRLICRLTGLIGVLLLAACTFASEDFATPPSALSDQQAIAIATKLATAGMPEIGSSRIPLQNFRAQLLTRAAAIKRLDHVDTLSDPEAIVWLVSIDGLWMEEFPRPPGSPTANPTAESFRHMYIIVNARTGAAEGTWATR
jgi:hypothetical protein